MAHGGEVILVTIFLTKGTTRQMMGYPQTKANPQALIHFPKKLE